MSAVATLVYTKQPSSLCWLLRWRNFVRSLTPGTPVRSQGLVFDDRQAFSVEAQETEQFKRFSFQMKRCFSLQGPWTWYAAEVDRSIG